MFFYLKFLFFAVCIFLSHIVCASSWTHLQTEHFRIVIDKDRMQQGQYIAQESERAYQQLKKVFSELPKSRVLIVVDHRTDKPNGSATNFPYPHIVIYPNLPSPYSSIGDYKEWVYELVLHELVHFLSFSPVHGVYKPLKWILGSYISPNFIMLPAWWHEGFAVHLETHLTHGGRLRSANYYEMSKVFSEDLASGKEGLLRINERYIPSFPYGQRPYFFGSLVLNQALQDRTPQDINAAIQAYSRTLPPYNIYSPTYKNLGESYVQARKSVKKYKFSKNENFKLLGRHSRWLDKNTVLVNHLNRNLFNEIRKYKLDAPESYEILFRRRNLGRFEISADGKKLLFDAIAPYQRRYQVRDLFIYNIKEQTQTRITNGVRVREGSFSPDGNQAIAVGLNMSKTYLCLVNLKAKTPRCKKLYTPDIGDRISFPYYISDKKVLFIEKKNDKKSELRIFDLESKSLSSIATDEFKEIYWAQALEGSPEKILLHALKKQHSARQAYLLKNGVWQALTQDPIGLAALSQGFGHLTYSRLTKSGYKTAWKGIDFGSVKVRSEEPIHPPPYHLSEKFLKDSEDSFELAQPAEVKPDTLWPYMLPHYWIPFIYPNYGGYSDHFLMTISTGSTDPLKRHSYHLSLGQDSISDRLRGSFTYTNHVYQNPWGFGLSQTESPLNETFSRTYQRAKLFTDLALFQLDSNLGGLNLRLDAEYLKAEIKDALPPLTTSGVSATLSYDDIAFLPARVAPHSGKYFSLEMSHYLDLEKNSFSYNYAEAYFETYFSKHVAPKYTSWKLFAKALYSDESLPLLLAPVNQSGYFAAARNQRGFVIRGYPSGVIRAFEGAYNLGIEFHFPILNVYKGLSEKLPIFFRRIYGSVFTDYGQISGDYYDGNNFQPTDYDRDFAGYGFEIHTDWTFMHYVPIKLSLGFFTPLKPLSAEQNASQVFLNVATPAIPN